MQTHCVNQKADQAAISARQCLATVAHLLLMWSHMAVEVGVGVLLEHRVGKGTRIAPALASQVCWDGCGSTGRPDAPKLEDVHRLQTALCNLTLFQDVAQDILVTSG